MTPVAKTLTRPSYGPRIVRRAADAQHASAIFDLTLDTGTYGAGGITITAASLGLKQVDFVSMSGVATNGTAGATANPIGITYASDGKSFTVQLYESGASGAALGEKTDTEAVAANFIIRLKAEGI